LPYPLDKFDAGTLPDPELNPLINPLLGAHMGRWAEVYFTSPPEKREEAIAELLRELQNSSRSEPAAAEPSLPEESVARDSMASDDDPDEAPEPSFAVAGEAANACKGCGKENLVGQKFCGRCGAPLPVLQEDSLSAGPANVHVARQRWDVLHESGEGDSLPLAIAGYMPPRILEERRQGALETAWRVPETALPSFALEPEPVAYRYRLYVGVALAVLLTVLVYMAWRGKTALSSDGTQSVPARAMPALPPAASSTSPPAATSNPQSTDTPSQAAPNGSPRPSQQPQQLQPQPVPKTDQTSAMRPAAQVAPVPAGSSTLGAGETGAEELALAERYLSGNPGMGRDSRQGAQWLWKAVGKGNVAASLTLSDLYLRGDGVPKSCDQARLLLDAAARKGKTAAAERLRHLQAFGCN